jgi:hypothetical protein
MSVSIRKGQLSELVDASILKRTKMHLPIASTRSALYPLLHLLAQVYVLSQPKYFRATAAAASQNVGASPMHTHTMIEGPHQQALQSNGRSKGRDAM